MNGRRVFVAVLVCLAFGSPRGETAATDSADTVFAVAAGTARATRGLTSAVSASTKGVQITPDPLVENQHLLVSKDVGSERWSISLNFDDTITGNVFQCDGGAPAFVWCDKIDDDHSPDFPNRVITWRCFGADSCAAPPCGSADQWQLINNHVQLTGSFFLP